MKYLGIDYGKKKIGIAMSDDSGRLAFPKDIFLNEGKKTIGKIAEIIEQEKINDVVIGHSTDFGGKDNPIMKEVIKFAGLLKEKTRVHVQFELEYLSSQESKRIITGHDDDARAAAIVLQSFLDKKNSL
ncbi:MAG: Holliday junction resolvase RuvX [Candidatus Paceibacterota bacterium]|jgi:putative Holliday junction resolvase